MMMGKLEYIMIMEKLEWIMTMGKPKGRGVERKTKREKGNKEG